MTRPPPSDGQPGNVVRIPVPPTVDGPADPVERLFASYRAAFVRYERVPTAERWRVAMNAFVTFNVAFIAECEDVAE